jgi:hypothetical protein
VSPADGSGVQDAPQALREFVERCATDLELIRSRVSVITVALQSGAAVREEAVAVLMRDVDEALAQGLFVLLELAEAAESLTDNDE